MSKPVPPVSLRRMKEMLNVHFYHEWDMIFKLLERQRNLTFTKPQIYVYDPISKRVVWDSPIMCELLIHFRNLNEFFYGKVNKKNANVRHYVGWNKRKHNKKSKINVWNKRIHKFLAHLSYSRSRGWKHWPILPLFYPHYKMLTLRFIKRVNKDKYYISSQMENLKQRLINESGVFST